MANNFLYGFLHGVQYGATSPNGVSLTRAHADFLAGVQAGIQAAPTPMTATPRAYLHAARVSDIQRDGFWYGYYCGRAQVFPFAQVALEQDGAALLHGLAVGRDDARVLALLHARAAAAPSIQFYLTSIDGQVKQITSLTQVLRPGDRVAGRETVEASANVTL